MIDWIERSRDRRTSPIGRMAVRLPLAVALVAALATAGRPAAACSAFAVYGSRTFYGMNWDYYSGWDGSIHIHRVGGMDVLVVYDQEGNDFVGMNSKGLMAAKIMVTPAEDFGVLHGLGRRKPQRIEMKDVFRKALFAFSTLDQVDRYLDDKMIFHSQTDMHDMFADAKGRAQVVEVGDTDNRITPMTGSFLIMSNFTQYYFKDAPYQTIVARGSDRYIAGYDYILKHREGFDVPRGMGMLDAMRCEDADYRTLGSFLFDPAASSVYFAVNRNFSKVWKLSIPDRTVETFQGFEHPMKLRVDQSIKLSDLKKLASYDPAAMRKFAGAFVEKPDPAVLATMDRRGDRAEAARDQVKNRVLAMALVLLSVPILISVRQARSTAAGKA